MFIVGLLLLSNITGLLLSQSYIIDGVPREYISSLEGSMVLPYLPPNDISVEYYGPSEVNATDPFYVEFAFPDGNLPSFQYRIWIHGDNGSRSFDLLQTLDENGSLSLSTLLPGFKNPGDYNISIKPDIVAEPGSMDPFIVGPWSLRIIKNLLPHPIPVLFDNLAFSSPVSSTLPNDELTFDITGLDDLSVDAFRLETSSGNVSSFVELNDHRWKLEEPGIIGKGWTKFQVIQDFGSGSEKSWDYLTNDPDHPIPRSSKLDVYVERVLSGTDELFEQENEGPMKIDLAEDLGLYVDEYYSIEMDLGDEDPDLQGISVEVNGSRLFLPILVNIGNNSYPSHLTSNGSYVGIFKTPASQGDDLKFRLDIGFPSFGEDVFETQVQLKLDHAPGIIISPDIYKMSTWVKGEPEKVEIKLSAEWENFNRKDFTSEPILKVDGEKFTWENETEDLSKHEYVISLDGGSASSGSSIEIISENSLEFANWLAFILPIPSIFLFIPVPITGWFAVAWFVLVSIACVASVALLFFRTSKPLWKKNPKGTTSTKLKKLFSSESDLALTSKTYLGALFFFYSVYLMLLLFDQPTPVPGILSSETPIWIRMFLLADASVWEEISGRVVLIGIPMVIFYTFKKWGKISNERSVSMILEDGSKRSTSLFERVSNIQIKKLFGGTDHFGNFEIFLVLLSGGLFGIAHLGWGPWKVLPTFVHGLLFGYLFIKVGLHASIAMHFLFDYTSFINEIIGVYGPTMVIVLLTAFALGGIFFADWTNRSHSWISKNWFNRPPRPAILLVIHSIIAILLGAFTIIDGGSTLVAFLFFSIPIVDLIGYLLWKVMRSEEIFVSWVIRGSILIWSYVSWLASPFGIAWAIDPGSEIDDHGS